MCVSLCVFSFYLRSSHSLFTSNWIRDYSSFLFIDFNFTKMHAWCVYFHLWCRPKINLPQGDRPLFHSHLFRFISFFDIFSLWIRVKIHIWFHYIVPISINIDFLAYMCCVYTHIDVMWMCLCARLVIQTHITIYTWLSG